MENAEHELEENRTSSFSDRIELERMIKAESGMFPKWTLLLLGVSWIIVFIISLLKGGRGARSIVGIKTCSSGYWIVTALAFPILFGFSFAVGLYMHIMHKKKERLGYQFIEGDIKWTLRNALLIPTMFLTAGIVAGLLGIGGGMITGPLMLELGMVPQVVTATSSFMIVSFVRFKSCITLTVLYRLFNFGTIRSGRSNTMGLWAMVPSIRYNEWSVGTIWRRCIDQEVQETELGRLHHRFVYYY